MKRFLGALVSFCLIVAAPAPSAWAQFAEAVGRGVSAPSTPAQVGAVRLSVPVRLPGLGASVAPLTGALPASMAPVSLLATVATPVAARAVKPAVAVRAAQEQLTQANQSLSGDPLAKPEASLGRLYDSSLTRVVLGVEPTTVLPGRAAADSGLERASLRDDGVFRSGPSVPNDPPVSPRGSKLRGAAKAIGLFAAGSVAVVGLQMAAVALAPAIFAVVPAAAVWAVSAGVLLLPAALYARYRLSLRDSPRLGKVKAVMDLALGVYAGALFVAAPSFVLLLTGAGALAAAAPAAGFIAGLAVRGAPFLDSVMVWGVLGLAPLAVAAAATGGLALAPLLAIMALPAMTTIAFFLGRIISAAETGAPFSVPGSLQKIRFPAFQWVMTGVVFALLTGYSAVHANMAFIAWQLLGSRRPSAWDRSRPLWNNLLNKAANFDLLYLGLLAFTAATGFTSPLTFLAVAFMGERGAVWTERLMTRFLPRAEPAPSTGPAPAAQRQDSKPSRWPRFHYWAKTVGILLSMAGAGVMMGLTVFGFHSLLTSMIPAVILSFLPFFFAHQIIKLVMKSKPADEAADPEFFSIMRDLRERINARRRARGKREIPMPEMVIDPLPVPNAYATGRSPFKALVGVTAAIKEMTLDPENVRAGAARLIAGVPADSKHFRVFRLAIAGSVKGVSSEATPAEVKSALADAGRTELKALGVRMLRGVLGHEFSHVMDRHMLSGSIAGAIASSIAFASYGVMWTVGHAQISVKKAFDRLLGRREAPSGHKTFVDPISIGAAAKSLPTLLKIFAALWAPLLVQIVQMASSRNNEGMADEDGALLSQDPESLALALGMLATWRPKEGFRLPGSTLPRMAALSHLMTVNPLQQAHEAGALPKLDAVTAAVVGKGDDFLFNLFVTHPDTSVRIQKLADMAEALRASKK